MRIVSVNVSLPRMVSYRGRAIATGIFKRPAGDGPIRVARENLEGDAQADRSVHGGPDKAVYAYPSEHYSFWEGRLGRSLDWGDFGENLTTAGLAEDTVWIGDRYRIGTAVFTVTEPRQPCYKLAMKLDRDDMIPLFENSGKSGFYLAVVDEGELGRGDAVERVSRSPHGVSVADVNRLLQGRDDAPLLERALGVPELAASVRRRLEKRRR